MVLHIDISEIRKLYKEKLEGKLEQQKLVSQATFQAQEQERNQLGRELHDNITQVLAALRMRLRFFLEHPQTNLAFLEECDRYTTMAIDEIREISHGMITPRFKEVRLAEALQALTFTYRNEKREVLLEIGSSDTILPVEMKENLYRIAQEALNNIHKYAEATLVKIFLRAEKGVVSMAIENNGVGFDSTKVRPGVGITNIKGRAEAFGGSVMLRSAQGECCIVVINIPL